MQSHVQNIPLKELPAMERAVEFTNTPYRYPVCSIEQMNHTEDVITIKIRFTDMNIFFALVTFYGQYVHEKYIDDYTKSN